MCGLFVGDWAFSASSPTVAVERGPGPSVEEELSENDVDELVELAFASEASVDLEGESSNGTLENVP
jgi:hypothetical protein